MSIVPTPTDAAALGDGAANGPADGSTGAIGAPRGSWRDILTPIVWLAVVGCAVILFSLLWNMFGMALGAALHAEITIEEQLPVFWGLVSVCIVLALTAVAALVGRRWVALVLAIVLGIVGGAATAVAFSSVRSVLAPVEQEQIDPGPMPCQCSSGGTCDCPGG